MAGENDMFLFVIKSSLFRGGMMRRWEEVKEEGISRMPMADSY